MDADLNARLIDESEARSRRKARAAEAEFYGVWMALPGSRSGMRSQVQRALQTYTILTIGDGLVTVIPALMISVSGGLIVTRASSEAKLGQDFKKQVRNPEPLLLAAGVLIATAAFPGLPKIPFLIIGGGLGAAAWCMRKNNVKALKASEPVSTPARDNVDSLLRAEPLATEVGLGLVKLVEGGPHSPLVRRISSIRRQLAAELGYIVPPVQYVVLLKGVEIARYELINGCEMAIHPGEKGPAHRWNANLRAGLRSSRHLGDRGKRRPGTECGLHNYQ